MNAPRILVIVTFLCTTAALHAQEFDFNSNCQTAYQSILSLRLKEGKTLLQAERKRNPDNLIVDFLENYHDFLKVYLADTRDEFEKCRKEKDLRLAQLATGNPASPYFFYSQAEVSIQWAALNIRFGEYLNAVTDIRRAYKLLEQNEKKFPEFLANKKTLGLLYSLIGSVPDKYKWAVSLLGMSGDINKGLHMLQQLIEADASNFLFKDEATIIYSMLLLNLQSDAERAWQVLQQQSFPLKDNLLSTYVVAYVGIHGKHSTESLKVLETKPQGNDYATFSLLSYLQGLAMLQALDMKAIDKFKQYINTYKGDAHIKSAYQKMAWCYLLQNDTVSYRHYIKNAAVFGDDLLDADKQAKHEAATGIIPSVGLLKARLLFDGASYLKALQELQNCNPAMLKYVEYNAEYHYRLARIYQELNEPDKALHYYSKAIESGKALPRYFAAKSALESGKIYEQRQQIDSAANCYNRCLTFEGHEYKNGLDQKAKAALERIGK